MIFKLAWMAAWAALLLIFPYQVSAEPPLDKAAVVSQCFDLWHFSAAWHRNNPGWGFEHGWSNEEWIEKRLFGPNRSHVRYGVYPRGVCLHLIGGVESAPPHPGEFRIDTIHKCRLEPDKGGWSDGPRKNITDDFVAAWKKYANGHWTDGRKQEVIVYLGKPHATGLDHMTPDQFEEYFWRCVELPMRVPNCTIVFDNTSAIYPKSRRVVVNRRTLDYQLLRELQRHVRVGVEAAPPASAPYLFDFDVYSNHSTWQNARTKAQLTGRKYIAHRQRVRTWEKIQETLDSGCVPLVELNYEPK